MTDPFAKKHVRPRITCSAMALGLCVAAMAQAVRAENAPPQRVSFYFAAHEDDWQLFMNPSAFMDVLDSKTKSVFIHTTAGDAGGGVGKGGRKHPYYLARENGAEVAIRFMADSDNQPAEKVASRVMLNGHPIYSVSYRNTVTYFLRLPDGHPSGSGFVQTGFQSLERLARGAIIDIAAIDGSTVYHGWSDLVATVKAILDRERAQVASIQLNVAELDAAINPGDHSDHRMTAQAALDAARELPCARRVHYVEYASARLPENLISQQRDMETSVLAATSIGLLALDHATLWNPYFRSYLGRNYFRVEEGTSQCQTPGAEAAVTVSGSRSSGTGKQRSP